MRWYIRFKYYKPRSFYRRALQVEAKEKTGQVKHKNQETYKEFSQLEKNLMLD